MKKLCNIVTLILSLILSVGVMTFADACHNKMMGKWMHCHYVQMDVFYIGIGLIVVSLPALFIKNEKIALISAFVQMALEVVAILLPGTIMDMCMMHTMRCYSVMKPFVTVMGILVIISALAGEIVNLLGGKQQK